ncbi:MAG TPA: hypothetical protein VMH27_12580 [Puia sp.]|nr:hypothetical protein [Puia sp.]
MNKLEKLFKPQEPFYKIQIGRRNFAFLAHQALALFGFLRKNVTLERFLVGNFAGARYFEPLFGTRIRSNLWHWGCIFA